MAVRIGNKVRVNFTLDPKVHELLLRHSEIVNMSQSAVVSKALHEYLLKQKDIENLLKGDE